VVALEPFAALRYDTGRVRLDDVICPPYDVVGPDERAQLAARSAYNAIHVELPTADRPGGDPYHQAAALLDRWRTEGVLRRDETPRLYAYRLRHVVDGRPRATRGVLGALSLSGLRDGSLLPHEETLSRARTDRLHLLRATRVNTSPIWGLSLAKGLADLVVPERPADAVAHDDAGVSHELWCLDEATTTAVAARVEEAPIVVADGHHRLQVAAEFAEELAATVGPDDPTTRAAQTVLAFVTELRADEVVVGPIHRLLRLSAEDALARLEARFSVDVARSADPRELEAAAVSEEAVALVGGGRAWWLRRPPAPPSDEAADVLASLDTTAISSALPSDAILGYANGADDVSHALEASEPGVGDAQSALIVRPVRTEQIAVVARAGMRFPPKSTFFVPKPRTGLVFRPLS